MNNKLVLVPALALFLYLAGCAPVQVEVKQDNPKEEIVQREPAKKFKSLRQIYEEKCDAMSDQEKLKFIYNYVVSHGISGGEALKKPPVCQDYKVATSPFEEDSFKMDSKITYLDYARVKKGEGECDFSFSMSLEEYAKLGPTELPSAYLRSDADDGMFLGQEYPVEGDELNETWTAGYYTTSISRSPLEVKLVFSNMQYITPSRDGGLTYATAMMMPCEALIENAKAAFPEYKDDDSCNEARRKYPWSVVLREHCISISELAHISKVGESFRDAVRRAPVRDEPSISTTPAIPADSLGPPKREK